MNNHQTKHNGVPILTNENSILKKEAVNKSELFLSQGTGGSSLLLLEKS